MNDLLPSTRVLLLLRCTAFIESQCVQAASSIVSSVFRGTKSADFEWTCEQCTYDGTLPAQHRARR